jgi:hypothetical protein
LRCRSELWVFRRKLIQYCVGINIIRTKHYMIYLALRDSVLPNMHTSTQPKACEFITHSLFGIAVSKRPRNGKRFRIDCVQSQRHSGASAKTQFILSTAEKVLAID